MKIEEYIQLLERMESKIKEGIDCSEELYFLGDYDEKVTPDANEEKDDFTPSLQMEQKFTQEQLDILKEWRAKLGVSSLDPTPFENQQFLRNFLKSIPEEDWFKYVENSYYYGHPELGRKVDLAYVICTRRTTPSNESKPEQCWALEQSEALIGSSRGYGSDVQRQHSVIIVSTRKELSEHNMENPDDDSDYNPYLGGAEEDDEVRTSYKPFPRSRILFAYKPHRELMELYRYLENGGLGYKEALKADKLMHLRNALRLEDIRASEINDGSKAIAGEKNTRGEFNPLGDDDLDWD